MLQKRQILKKNVYLCRTQRASLGSCKSSDEVDYKNSTTLLVVSIKIETKREKRLLFQFSKIGSVYLSSL